MTKAPERQIAAVETPADDLPEGWTTRDVDSLFTSFSGGTPSRGTASYWGGSIPWLSSGDIKTDRITSSSESITSEGLSNSSAKLCRRGAVVVVVRSGILKHTLPIAVLAEEATINQDIKCFDSGDDDLNEWLALSLRSSKSKILALNREGTTVQSVKYETLKHFPLSIPPPEEQQRIVARIEELLTHVNKSRAHLVKVPKLLKSFRQSVLAAACTEGEDITLDDIVTDLKYGTAQKCTPVQTGIPVLRIPNIGDGSVRLDDLKYAKLPPKEFASLSLEPGDILVIRSNGSVSLVGKSALVSEAAAGFAYAGYLIRLRFDHDRALPSYVNLALQTQDLRDQIEMPARSTSGVHNINSREVLKLRIRLPSLESQKAAVRRVEALFALADKIEKRVEAATKRADKLTQSILAKAFRGELVPTEAELARQEGRDYETASQLLDRIRASREAEPTKSKAPRRTGRRTALARKK